MFKSGNILAYFQESIYLLDLIVVYGKRCILRKKEVELLFKDHKHFDKYKKSMAQLLYIDTRCCKQWVIKLH